MGAYVSNDKGEGFSMTWELISLLLDLGNEHGWHGPGWGTNRMMLTDGETTDLAWALRKTIACIAGKEALPPLRTLDGAEALAQLKAAQKWPIFNAGQPMPRAPRPKPECHGGQYHAGQLMEAMGCPDEVNEVVEFLCEAVEFFERGAWVTIE